MHPRWRLLKDYTEQQHSGKPSRWPQGVFLLRKYEIALYESIDKAVFPRHSVATVPLSTTSGRAKTANSKKVITLYP